MKAKTTSSNDAKAGQRNRVELGYLNLKLKQLDKQKRNAYSFHSRSIDRIQTEFDKIKIHTGLYDNNNVPQRLNSKDSAQTNNRNFGGKF